METETKEPVKTLRIIVEGETTYTSYEGQAVEEWRAIQKQFEPEKVSQTFTAEFSGIVLLKETPPGGPIETGVCVHCGATNGMHRKDDDACPILGPDQEILDYTDFTKFQDSGFLQVEKTALELLEALETGLRELQQFSEDSPENEGAKVACRIMEVAVLKARHIPTKTITDGSKE